MKEFVESLDTKKLVRGGVVQSCKFFEDLYKQISDEELTDTMSNKEVNKLITLCTLAAEIATRAFYKAEEINKKAGTHDEKKAQEGFNALMDLIRYSFASIYAYGKRESVKI